MFTKLRTLINKKYGADILYIFILSITTICIWYPLVNLVLTWESYTYISSHFYLPLFTNTWISFGNFDVQSMFTGSILSKLIGTNMPIYFGVEIFFILIINICMYFLGKTLIGSKKAGFIASFLFSVYFFGIGFFAPNYYATFLQRIILNVPILLISFIFLHRYLAEKNAKFYIVSIVLFILSIFIARFGIFLSFFVLLYPFFWELLLSFNLRSFIRALLISLPYMLTIVFFLKIHKLYGDAIGPKESIMVFLAHPEKYHYIENVIRQLVNMSSYPSVIQAIRLERSPFAFLDPASTFKFAIPITLTYIISILTIWIKDKKHRALLLTIVSSLILSLFVNVYLDRFDVQKAAGMNRYYYYPSFILAIFWSLFIVSVFKKNKLINKLIIGAILLGFYLINAALFQQYFSDLDRYSITTKKIYEYIVHNGSQLPQNSFIIVSPGAEFGPYEARFFTEQIGKKRDILFRTENLGWGDWRPIASSSAHVLRLNYNEACSCVQEEILK